MSKLLKYGNVKAFIRAVDNADGGDARYILIGTAFLDEQQRMVLKIDALPMPLSGWRGWVNIFEDKPEV